MALALLLVACSFGGVRPSPNAPITTMNFGKLLVADGRYAEPIFEVSGPAKANLVFGPELHGGGVTEVGREYGTGFNFPIAGCWDIHFTDGALGGDVYLVVE